ncbi:hypothetical protein L1887_57027 [Cichorium endivia]|nr:hypothetical protein L1887_57027 [Cichorium endivia]
MTGDGGVGKFRRWPRFCGAGQSQAAKIARQGRAGAAQHPEVVIASVSSAESLQKCGAPCGKRRQREQRHGGLVSRLCSAARRSPGGGAAEMAPSSEQPSVQKRFLWRVRFVRSVSWKLGRQNHKSGFAPPAAGRPRLPNARKRSLHCPHSPRALQDEPSWTGDAQFRV